jgi:hypothetical protein
VPFQTKKRNFSIGLAEQAGFTNEGNDSRNLNNEQQTAMPALFFHFSACKMVHYPAPSKKRAVDFNSPFYTIF